MAVWKHILYCALIGVFGCAFVIAANHPPKTIGKSTVFMVQGYRSIQDLAEVLKRGNEICMQPRSFTRDQRLAKFNKANPELLLECKDEVQYERAPGKNIEL
jgi:hypothetical protein